MDFRAITAMRMSALEQGNWLVWVDLSRSADGR
jgi:hypothetical protein